MSDYKIKQPTVTISFWGALGQQVHVTREEQSKNARGTSRDERKLKESLTVPRCVAILSHYHTHLHFRALCSVSTVTFG